MAFPLGEHKLTEVLLRSVALVRRVTRLTLERDNSGDVFARKHSISPA